MSLENERRWLTKDDSWRKQIKNKAFVELTYGYLAKNGVNVYVLTANSRQEIRSHLCIRVKGADGNVQMIRFPLKYKVGQKLLKHCPFILSKRRWWLTIDDIPFAIDEFRGGLEPLVIVELTLKYKDLMVMPPPWVGKEITGKSEYSNARLVEFGLPSKKKYDEAP